MEGGLLGRLVYWGRTGRALRLFETRRREVDWVDRVLARKVASLNSCDFFLLHILLHNRVLPDKARKSHYNPCKPNPHLFQSPLYVFSVRVEGYLFRIYWLQPAYLALVLGCTLAITHGSDSEHGTLRSRACPVTQLVLWRKTRGKKFKPPTNASCALSEVVHKSIPFKF